MTSCPHQRPRPQPYPLYAPQFAADPHRAYAELRAEHGPLAPVELAPGVPATLVLGYYEAREILRDEERFPADPRGWQEHVPDSCPVKPMLQWRPNAIRTSGAEHRRYRQATVDALKPVDQHQLRELTEKTAAGAIADFASAGQADLLSQFAWPVVFKALSSMLGCPDHLGQRIADGMMALFDGDDATDGNARLEQAVADLVRLKRVLPGDDVTTRLLAHKPELSQQEMTHQVVTLYGAGIEPVVNLITNALVILLADDDLAGDVHAGTGTVHEVLDHVLYKDPPLANYCMSYPPHPVQIDGYLLPAHQPVVISMAAANNDPALGNEPAAAGNRAHLAWSAGPHACPDPARAQAYLIAETALTCLLDALPEAELACPPAELTWRPGQFHRALTHLPVRFRTALN
ncbi:cytochrome P450 (plasmid) [Streptomyces sp. SDT5-1]|uniref:cytochrome P450 n=1 Tax=Streptomyces sp. SDT5-1 TaxID=3406418 RepID=UPI003FD59564